MMFFGIVLLIAVVGVFWAIGAYNGFVRRRNESQNAYSQIDVQLKRRYDLIPNLVETAKGYMKHEREALEAVIAARAKATSASDSARGHLGDADAMRAVAASEGALSASLGRLFALAEAYPDLKANHTMATLMEELTSTENKIGFARQAYNDSVMSYNTAIESFPASLIAAPTGFERFRQLESTQGEAERAAVKVSF